MPATRPQSNAYALCSTLACLLETISEKGYWVDPQESWEPILTCVAVEVLMDAGLTSDQSWVIQRAGHTRMSLETPLRWLNSRILADGSFGTDLWEACRLAHTIEKHKLHSYFPNYPELHKRILAAHINDTLLTGDSDWIGPGFIAAAANYFDSIGRQAESDTLIAKILSMQERDGHWLGSIVRAGHPIVSPVWHTSQVVLTLARKNPSQYRDSINRAVAWITANQDSSGKWPDIQQYVIYSTCYAILALDQAENPDLPAISRGLDYLKSAMKPDGRFHDLGGTLMAAIALLAVVGHNIDCKLSTVDFVLARIARAQVDAAEKTATAAKAEAETLKIRNDAYEKKFHNAEYGVTKKQLFLVALAVTFIIPTMSALANKVLSKLWPANSDTAEHNQRTLTQQPSTVQQQPTTPQQQHPTSQP